MWRGSPPALLLGQNLAGQGFATWGSEPGKVQAGFKFEAAVGGLCAELPRSH